MQTNNSPGTVRFDMIDYRETGTKGHPFLEIADYPNMGHAIRDISRTGWDAPSEELMMTCHLVTDERTRTILAVGVYVSSDQSDLPALTWVLTQSGTIAVRYYEAEYAESVRRFRGPSLPEKGGTDD